MLNPWTFGLEAVQQGWQAQSALAFSLMRSFAGGVPKQTTSSPLIPDTVPDAIKAQEEVVAIGHVREAPAATINGQKGACRDCRCATSQSPEGFAGLQEDISREGAGRIKTGGRG
jgi:hypothetical protein